MKKVYSHPICTKIKQLYGELLRNYDLSIQARLDQMASISLRALGDKNEIVCVEYSNYHPDLLGKKPREIFEKKLMIEDARTMIAHQFGFHSWEAVASLGEKKSNVNFEKAVDALLDGDLDLLKETIQNHPNLIHEKSDYGHEATLLHYCASNGFEMYRQVVPMNLPVITNFLLKSGTNAKSTMKVYGGHFDTYALLVSSAHPAKAGIIEEMKKVFEMVM